MISISLSINVFLRKLFLIRTDFSQKLPVVLLGILAGFIPYSYRKVLAQLHHHNRSTVAQVVTGK